jgi:hypothetical protein
MTPKTLVDLERAGWRALSEGNASAFYERTLASEVLMILPGDLVIDDRRAAIDSMSGTGWDSFTLSDERVFPVDDECAVVAYKATAKRAGLEYTARFTSTYRREADTWKLAVHQQTPA